MIHHNNIINNINDNFFFAIKREFNSKLEKSLIYFPPPSIREESDFKNDQKCQNAQKLVNFELR